MDRRNSMLALGIGLGTGALAFFLLFQKASEVASGTTPMEILVASRYIPAGSVLRSDMVERKAIPKSFVAPSAIREIREVEGFQSLVPLSAGEQVLSNKFGLGEPSLSAELAPGHRAYTLEVTETSGVGGLLRPGDQVDLIAKASGNGREITTFAFQKLSVLAVGKKLDGKRPSPEDPGSGMAAEGDYGTVTLAVTPEEAETLFYLEGRPLRLVLRAPGDEEIVSIAPQSEAEVLSKISRFVPPKKGRSIEIIRDHSPKGDE